MNLLLCIHYQRPSPKGRINRNKKRATNPTNSVPVISTNINLAAPTPTKIPVKDDPSVTLTFETLSTTNTHSSHHYHYCSYESVCDIVIIIVFVVSSYLRCLFFVAIL